MNALLGRTVVVDHLDHGVQLAKARRYRFPVVTLEGGDSPARRFYDRRLSQPAGAYSRGRGKPSRSSGPRPAGRGQAARCWSVPAGKPSGRRRPWRPAKVPGPTPPETLLRSQNDQEETLPDPGRGTGIFTGHHRGHSLRCLPSCGTSCGPLRQTRPARTGCSGHGPANPGAEKRRLPSGRPRWKPWRLPGGRLSSWQSTGQKLALERARGE